MSTIFYVNEEREFLQNYLSPAEINECVSRETSNLKRMEILWTLMIQNGKRELYNAFIEYFDKKSRQCNKLSESLLNANESSSSHGMSSSFTKQDESEYLQEKVKILNEELQHWRSQSTGLLDLLSSLHNKTYFMKPHTSKHFPHSLISRWKQTRKVPTNIDDIVKSFSLVQSGLVVVHPEASLRDLTSYGDMLVATLDKCLSYVSSSFYSRFSTNTDFTSRHKVLKISAICTLKLRELCYVDTKRRVHLAHHMKNTHQHESWLELLYYLNRMGVFHHENIFQSYLNLLASIGYLVYVSDRFGSGLIENGILFLLYENLSMSRHVRNTDKEHGNLWRILTHALGIVFDIIRRPENTNYFDESWKDILEDVFVECECPKLRMTCLFIWGYLDCETEEEIVMKWSEMIPLCCEQLTVHLKTTEEVVDGFTVKEILHAISALVAHDSMKYQFAKNKGVTIIKNIFHGISLREIPETIEILMKLSSCRVFGNELNEDKDLLNSLKILHVNKSLDEETRWKIEKLYRQLTHTEIQR